jgi:hypothetical protein
MLGRPKIALSICSLFFFGPAQRAKMKTEANIQPPPVSTVLTGKRLVVVMVAL